MCGHNIIYDMMLSTEKLQHSMTKDLNYKKTIMYRQINP